MVRLDRQPWLEMVAEAWSVYPLEACGLMLGPPGAGRITQFVPVENAARSSRIFQLDGRGFMKAERLADDTGLEVLGVMHSHTHTAAYPSPTDVAEATKPLVPPTWYWLIVSLAWGEPETRIFSVAPPTDSFGLVAAGIAEVPLLLTD